MRKLGKRAMRDEHLNGAVCVGEIRDMSTTGLVFRKGRYFFALYFGHANSLMKSGALFDFVQLDKSELIRLEEKEFKVFQKIAGHHYLEEVTRGVFKEVNP